MRSLLLFVLVGTPFHMLVHVSHSLNTIEIAVVVSEVSIQTMRPDNK